ncbi:glycoside hydrolase [Sistotremastrum suecicum HHB10207 ss-3]|uniref:Glycoside hydrolase n=1 Tax=Sistotremastrum suecicum HHB10207 ss-3 TaxID=1314776 RepID=A0A165Z601_9AGAM|nr:glycoside hydrolase [Sistotremastrum suecicum HHB10207 ss-3]
MLFNIRAICVALTAIFASLSFVKAFPIEKRASTFIAPAPRWVVYSDDWLTPPASSTLAGINVFILSFYTHSGAQDQAQNWEEMAATQRASILADYHANGISLMVSAFGSTDSPTTSGVDPNAFAVTLANWVKQYGLDGVDVDYEDFTAINSGTGSAETWLITFTKALRAQLPAGQYILTHAPVAPWFTSSTSLYPHGAYRAVDTGAGSSIDWYNLQFYNQGSDYTTCTTLLTTSNSDFPGSSIFEINAFGVPLSKLVIGKPATTADATTGYMDLGTLAGCLGQAKAKGWNAGAMFWQYPHITSAMMQSVRAQSFPYGGGSAPPPTTTTSSTTTTKSTTTTSSTKSSTPTSPAGGKCSGIAAWQSGVAYTGGSEVTYK